RCGRPWGREPAPAATRWATMWPCRFGRASETTSSATARPTCGCVRAVPSRAAAWRRSTWLRSAPSAIPTGTSRTAATTASPAGRGWWRSVLDPELIRDNLARVREAVGPGVEILAATKYVEAADLPALAAGGVALVGENRSDALLEKQALHGPLFTWDFIGQLQSRKVRDIVGRVRLIHSVGSLSACSQVQARAEAPADCLLEVNVAGEGTKAGVPLAEVDGFLEQVEELDRVRFRGLMTMPPLAATPDEARPWFAAL